MAQINTKIVPSFYGLLRATDPTAQNDIIDQLQSHIHSLNLAADETGPFFLGTQLCMVDVHFAPFALRLGRVLKPARGWTDPRPGTRWQRWLDALEREPHVRATMSGDELYAETVELLAQETGAAGGSGGSGAV